MTVGPSTRRWPLYLGGFLGPFGGAMVNAILPEIARGVGSDEAGVALALTTYMIPFSLALLISGTFGMRWGLARTIRWAYVLFAVASVVAGLVTSLGWFLAARSVQGVANAFTTPLLVTLLSTQVPKQQLGRALGTFASLQAAGQAFAPLVGGLAAEWSYRLAFVAVGVTGLTLAFVTSSAGEVSRRREADWCALANPRLARSASIALCAQFGQTAVMILAALIAADRFGLSAGQRGALVAAFGLAGLATGRLAGVAIERFGLVGVGVASLTGLAGAVAAMAHAGWVVVLVGLVALAGALGTAARILTNSLALASTPSNTGGATSVTMALQFLGTALVPTLIPLYHVDPALACGLTGSVVAVGAVVAFSARGRVHP